MDLILLRRNACAIYLHVHVFIMRMHALEDSARYNLPMVNYSSLHSSLLTSFARYRQPLLRGRAPIPRFAQTAAKEGS
jgi:hypothetical protein